MAEAWDGGDAYQRYVGRWSRRVAEVFVPWLGGTAGERWVDVGCGTGALTGTVLAVAGPAAVVGVDRSRPFVAASRSRIGDPRATFYVGDAQALPLRGGRFDRVVSGLALNFVPDAARAVAEFVRVAAPGGSVAAYVWDYAAGMQLLRYFWDAAVALDPAAAGLDEGQRFPLGRPDPLRRLWRDAGLAGITVRPVDVPTVFTDFDDYWRPFLGGQGPAPGYTATLPDDHRRALRDLLHARLPTRPDGSIPLTARAWAVHGTT
jgi:SAM-dependent methyltransferase